jgi:anti-sigma B factor antagonist
MLEFVTEQIKDILVIRIQLVRATLSNASLFKETLLEIIEQNHKKIIIDCRTVEYMDSTFLGAMVVSLKKLNALDGDLKIIFSDRTSPIWVMFETTSMIKVFKCYDSVEKAVGEFNTSE